MITLSLNEIRDHGPCKSGWETLLKYKKDTHWNEQFPLSDIIDSNGLNDALWCLKVRPEHSNLWRKYALWCARQVEHLMTDERSKAALDVAWRHSDGQATDKELADARDVARDVARAAARAAAGDAAWAAAWAAADAAGSAEAAAWAAADSAAWAAWWGAGLAAAGDAAWDAARAAQEKKLREILQAGEWSDE